MKEIDFIPEWYKANQNRKRRYHRQYMMLGGLLVIMMIWSFIIGHHVNQVHADVEAMQSMYEKGHLKVDEAMILESEIALLQQQAVLLEDASPRTNTSAVLAELSWLVRDSIVLSKVSLKNETIEQAEEKSSEPTGIVQVGAPSKDKDTVRLRPTRTKVTLTGVAAKGADAADLIARLEESDYFEQVSPVYTRGKTIKNCDVIEFEISAYIADYKLQK
jgi:hypothetical protein